MVAKLFLGISLIGAEWVLYLLLLLSILSVALMFERVGFYRQASKGLKEFRERVRKAAGSGKWDEVLDVANTRVRNQFGGMPDLEAALTQALLTHSKDSKNVSPEVLSQVAQDVVVRARLQWERNLAVLATIGNNAPFIGLFGTVLGIIKAFHDLSQQMGNSAPQAVTAGISEALIATAVGILVAIPAAAAFNLFQRKVKSAVAEAEALKSFLIGKLVP